MIYGSRLRPKPHFGALAYFRRKGPGNEAGAQARAKRLDGAAAARRKGPRGVCGAAALVARVRHGARYAAHPAPEDYWDTSHEIEVTAFEKGNSTGRFEDPIRAGTLIWPGSNATWDWSQTSKARLLEAHPELDLCVIGTVNKSVLRYGKPILGVRSSTDLRPGAAVFAIGNPAPDPQSLPSSLTTGIISALRGNLIQMTAPITHGSSGGALFDENGNLIGITAGGFESTHGLNFAIPADLIWNRYGR